MIWTVAAALIVAATSIGIARWYRADSVLRRRQRAQMMVTLKDGTTFRGVLTDHDRRTIVLASVEHLSDATTRVPVDGEVVLQLSDVKYTQRL